MFIAIFIATLFTVAKIWKQPKCSSTGEWIRKDVGCVCMYTYIYIYIHTHIYTYVQWNISHIKNKMLFAAMWLDLENKMLSEISQRKTNTI